MVAVHARQMSADDVVAAISRQQGYAFEAALQVDDLLTRLRTEDEPATLVLDALEALEPRGHRSDDSR